MQTYKPPIPYDAVLSRNTHLKTVSFESRFIQIGTKRYEVYGSESSGDDTLHYLRNVDTNDKRDVLGTTIRQWVDKSQT